MEILKILNWEMVVSKINNFFETTVDAPLKIVDLQGNNLISPGLL